jgi:hypothetical protein
MLFNQYNLRRTNRRSLHAQYAGAGEEIQTCGVRE